MFRRLEQWIDRRLAPARAAAPPAIAAEAWDAEDEEVSRAILSVPCHYADLAIVATDVVKGANAVVENGTAGASITAGQTVYQDATDSNKYKLADSNNTSATATVRGIALHAATAGQPLAVQTAGDLTITAVATAGKVYVNSANPGGIAPAADLAAGWKTTVIGVALTTSSLRLMINNTDVTN